MSFEKIPISIPERKEASTERLENWLREKAKELKKMGFPVNEELRIEETQFIGVYPREKIEEDREKVAQRKEEWMEKDIRERKFGIEKIGEKFEKITTFLLNKHLENAGLVVVRAAEYDDIFQGVDHLVLDIKTGNVVAGIDSSVKSFDKEYEKKAQKVLEMNLGGGAIIKYGVIAKKEGEGIKIEKRRIQQVPVFLFNLPQTEVSNLIEEFQPEKTSPEEERVFRFFLASLQYQTENLTRKDLHAYHQLRERIDIFQTKIKEISDKEGIK
jgi:hypothetical protein